MTERSIYTKMSSAGHHVYNEIWTPVCGEVLEVNKEPDNALQKQSKWKLDTFCTNEDLLGYDQLGSR